MNEKRFAKYLMMVVVITTLSSCSSDDMSDLQAFIAAEKAKPPGRIPPVPEPKYYPAHEYAMQDMRNPFAKVDRVVVEEGGGAGLDSGKIGRNLETLESYPLDTLQYVGSLVQDDTKWAIVTSPDNLVHRVEVGNYLGQNAGKIITISELKIEILERIPNGIGGYVDREAALSIIE